jgi:DNA-binding NarL/FixJ family response regulator
MRDVFLTVLVVPNGLLREGIARILSATQFRILDSAASLNDSVLSALSPHQSVLLVIGAGDDSDAMVTQIELFKQKQPAGRVAVLADRYQRSDVLSAFRAGANAYLIEVANCRAFVKSLESVMLGATIMPSEILASIFDPEDEAINQEIGVQAEALVEAAGNDVPHLSAQEKRILRHLVEGNSNKVIARKIEIAEATVKVHIKAILRKIRVHNRTQAAIWAVGNGSLVSPIDTASYDLEGKADRPSLFNGHSYAAALPKA